MIIIGADESGTGAWAGPFTVCALAVWGKDLPLLTAAGAQDSKTMSDAARRRVMEHVVDIAIVGKCEMVEVSDIVQYGQKRAWRRAMESAIGHVRKIVGPAKAVIDGNVDSHLASRFGKSVEFKKQADALVPVVSAASIIAKTLRNDRMLDLHLEFPEYGWAKNTGYGTPEHVAAITRHGKTAHHRPVKSLDDTPLRPTRVVNLREERFDVYIGRAGQGEDGYFGNPVRVGDACPVCGSRHMTPGATIPCYRTYFENRLETDLEFAKKVARLRHKILGCFCVPGPCHGTVIAEYLDKSSPVP